MHKLMTRTQVAELLQLKPNTLACWSCNGNGPRLPVVRIGRQVRYRASDVVALLEANTTDPDHMGTENAD